MKRIFIAINLPSEIKKQLSELQNEISNLFPEEAGQAIFRWVKPENLHITLLFLGEIKEEKILDLIQEAKDAVKNVKSFKIGLKKVCYDIPKKLPRLIWIELEKNNLLKQIAEKLGNFNFNPHITLARIKTWQWKRVDPEEQPNIEQEIDLEIPVESIDIMESRLKRGGSEYIILQKIMFGGPTSKH